MGRTMKVSRRLIPSSSQVFVGIPEGEIRLGRVESRQMIILKRILKIGK
jgi:hypothetical protein